MLGQNELINFRNNIGTVAFILLYPVIFLFNLLYLTYKKWFCSEMEKNIKNEVAVVTGGAHGLGRAIAIELAKRGCHIAVVDINLAEAKATVKIINNLFQVNCKAYKANVASFEELEEVNKQVCSDLGPVTILINNAAILLLSNAENPQPSEVQDMLNVNILSHFWTKSIFLPKMKELHKGHIVTISSAACLIPLPYNSEYTASKHATTGHMAALRMELAVQKQDNIHVCTVMPCFIDTNEPVSALAKQIKITSLIPLINGKKLAQRVVIGMLRGEQEIIVPGYLSFLYLGLCMLPTRWRDNLLLRFMNSPISDMCVARGFAN